MKLVWLTPLLSIAQSMAPIGGKNDKCTWGPSYWCTSITEAKECATTRFCLGSKQWAAPITTDNQMCKLCTQVIDSIIEQVESNEDNFKPILEQMCDYCSTPDKCIDSIEKHWEDIKDMINNELSSNVVCSALNMCQQADEEFTVNQFTLAAGFTGNLMTPRKIMEIPAEIEDDSDTHIRFAPAAKVQKSVDVNSCSKTCQDCVNWAVDAKALMQSPKRMNQMMKTIHLQWNHTHSVEISSGSANFACFFIFSFYFSVTLFFHSAPKSQCPHYADSSSTKKSSQKSSTRSRSTKSAKTPRSAQLLTVQSSTTPPAWYRATTATV
jgi:hypothetical protein